MEHYNVLIMTPGYSMETGYVTSLLTTIKYLNANGITWGYSSLGFSDVAIARENTVLGRTSWGLNSNYEKPLSGNATYDKLFLIDSDISWNIEDFLQLYYSEFDLISGAYMQSDGQTTTLLKKIIKTNSSEAFTTGMKSMVVDEVRSHVVPFEIAACGLGFVCIKQGVFESIERPWFEHRAITKKSSDTEFIVELLSEDISFMHKVKEAGFKVYADPRVLVEHTKKVTLTWY